MTDDRAQLEQHLSSLVAEFGRRLLRDPQQVAASVGDVAPGRRAERRALEAAAEAGVADALLDISDGGMLPDDRRGPVAQRLADAAGLPPELAAWAVSAFAHALQLSSGADPTPRQTLPGGGVVADPDPTEPAWVVRTPTPPDWTGAGAATTPPPPDPGRERQSAAATSAPTAGFVVPDPPAGAGTTYRFNPAPGWPPVPGGWVPPPRWQPDPTWPAPPPGWQWYAVEQPASIRLSGADKSSERSEGRTKPSTQPSHRRLAVIGALLALAYLWFFTFVSSWAWVPRWEGYVDAMYELGVNSRGDYMLVQFLGIAALAAAALLSALQAAGTASRLAGTTLVTVGLALIVLALLWLVEIRRFLMFADYPARELVVDGVATVALMIGGSFALWKGWSCRMAVGRNAARR